MIGPPQGGLNRTYRLKPVQISGKVTQMAGTFRDSYGVNVWTSDKQVTIVDGVKNDHKHESVQVKPGGPDGGTPYNAVDIVTTTLSNKDGEFKSHTVSLTKHAALALSLELRKLAIGV